MAHIEIWYRCPCGTHHETQKEAIKCAVGHQLTGTELTAEQPKVQRKRIDYGKIMALKNAGWDNGKIADEMHMSKASVSQAVSKCKKMRMEGHLDEAENKGAVSDNQDTV